MRSLLIPFTFILSACGGGSTENTPTLINPTPPIVEEDSKELSAEVNFLYQNSSYYQISVMTEYNGVDVPKYSGNLSTYSAKHQPTSVEDYFVYSDNVGVGMNIFLSDKEGNRVLIDNIATNDPHQNPVIIKDDDGLLHIVVSSRGNIDKGYYYTVDDNLNVTLKHEHNMAYPQLFLHEGNVTILYNKYKDSTREVYVENKECGEVPVLTGMGHYFMSTYKDGVLYLVYNNHVIPNSVSRRQDLNLIKSFDGGCSWTEEEVLYDSGDMDIYLKSISVEDGEVKALFTEAETWRPTQGSKVLKLYNGNTVEDIIDVHHNYAAGYYYKDLIVFPVSEDKTKASGNLNIFVKEEDEWVVKEVIEGDFNYAKRNQYVDSYSGVVAEEDGIYTLNITYE